MTAKTYKFSLFKKQTVEHYVATAKELRFLPAQRIRIDRYNSESFVEFVFLEKRGSSWFFGPKNAAKHGILLLEIVND